jgi:hypothetical protein
MAPNRYNKEQVMKALMASKGLISIAGEKLGVCYTTMHNYINKYELRDFIVECRDAVVDNIQKGVYSLATESDDPRIKLDASKFVLNSLAKPRGFGNIQHSVDMKAEHTVKADEETAALLLAAFKKKLEGGE